MAKYSYLAEDTIIETFRSSRQYTEGLTDQFFEFERLARNKPHGSIPREYPKTTDGTTASIIRKTPHRIIQQLPTGRVVSDSDDWLNVIAEFIYKHKIIPSANEGYALLQKCWTIVEKFLTFGFCPVYTPFVEHNGYFCTDMRIPYWADVFIQPGKLSDSDSSYVFLRSWWQTKDIEALIASQQALKPASRTWNVANLSQIKDMTATKDNKAQTPAEREKNINTKGGVELITGFQRGVGAKFYTFHVNSGLIVRTKVNKDPRGELPISFFYGDIDGSNPFGRSIIELVGPLQNLMDAEMQMYQYNRALMLNPPLIKLGNFSKNKIKFAPNTIIDVGADPNAKVEPLAIDSTAIANWPNNYGLMKSQMINLLASPDTSISADVGNPGFSKTPQGVQASQANLSVDDNYVRKSFETGYERWSETAINLYFAEREGIEELQLDDDTVEELLNLDGFDPGMISPDNKIRINYSSATPKLYFRVDASSSKQSADPAQIAIAQGLLETVAKNPMLNKKYGGRIDIDELAEKIVKASGIQDPELVAPKPTKAEKAAKAQNAQTGMDAFSPMYDKPQFRVDYKDVESPSARAKILELGGAKPDEPLPGVAPGVSEEAARQSGQPGEQVQESPVTADHLIKAHEVAHNQEMDKAKLDLEKQKLALDAAKTAGELKIKQQVANKPVPKPAATKKAKAK
jgi:hypothetical protein